MNKKTRTVGTVLTAIVGVVAILSSNGNGPSTPTYIRVDDPSFTGRAIYDVAEAIIGGAPLLVAVGDGGNWTTSDGATWTFHNSVKMTKVVARSAEFFAVAGAGGLRRSIDGQNWTAVSLSRAQNVNQIVRISGGGLVALGMMINSTNQYFFPAVWISADGVSWDRHDVGSSDTAEAHAASSEGSLLVVGGGHRPIGSVLHRPRFWYSEDNGATWASASGPYLSQWGIVSEIVKGDNNVFYASSSSGSTNALLWKSVGGKAWQIVQDSEVAAVGEEFMFRDSVSTGLSNATAVMGSRAGAPSVWSYVRTYDRWEHGDASTIYGTETPTGLTGMGYSPNIAPGFVYTGTRTVSGTVVGAIWLKAQN